MDVYFLGMLISMICYIILGIIVGKKLKNANDFYVADRNAPTFFIVGSIVASYIGTGSFMGDAGECYAGFLAALLVIVTMKTVGPIYGSVFFGRYLRRSESVTLPQFFGKRFNSKPVQKLSAIVAIISMSVYLLSVVQGVGTLMTIITDVPYIICITLIVITFTLLTILSGSKGVLMSDTLMFAIFSSMSLVGLGIIVNAAGGWYEAVGSLVNFERTPGVISWTNNLDYFYPTGMQNFVWAVGYGIVWGAIAMVAPWQSSRYLMAKNEHAVVRAGSLSAVGLFFVEFFVIFAAVFVNVINPNIETPSHVLVWAATNIMPTVIGVIFVTGILAAGISSSTTFLSLIGSSFSVDLLECADEKKGVRYARLCIGAVGLIVLALAITNPPSIFWIMYLGATVLASSWLLVAIASVWSKRITKTGAFWGMLLGCLGCFSAKLYSSLTGTSLPIYLDPFFFGVTLSFLGILIGSALTKVTDNELSARASLFIMPESEINIREMAITKKYGIFTIFLGLTITAALILLWAVPVAFGS